MSDVLFDGDEEVAFLCKDDAGAIGFVKMLTESLHFWDDLVDGDKELDRWLIDERMWNLMVVLPRNQFYAQNFVFLNNLLVTAIINWQVATETERRDVPVSETEAITAFIIRSSYVDVLVGVALIVGGKAHADECARRLREKVHNEGFAEYKAALIREKEARNGMRNLR